MPLRGIIAAVSPEWVIGVNNQLPWNYPEDTKRFKQITAGKTVIMGRKTFESLDRQPLPKRRNIVITRQRYDNVETFPSVAEALATCGEQEVWFIGGEKIFAEGMSFADIIDLTFIPDHVTASDAAYFPKIDDTVWQAGPLITFETDPRLSRRVYKRRQHAR